ncbi:unnamed protein product [Periconia digitata]|uniref:Negative regulator of differentiation 1 n=1 Tax=Periconia digitata TaxID=1303443 RepID=A0A9W4UU12_9PLEO|nr:unnamed protein product [Periconia digitata]
MQHAGLYMLRGGGALSLQFPFTYLPTYPSTYLFTYLLVLLPYQLLFATMDATVTIGRAYFQALLRRAEFDTTPSLSDNVTISKSEHDYLTQALRDLNQLKTVLFRGGLTPETLNTLRTSECEPADDQTAQGQTSSWEDTFSQSQTLSANPGGLIFNSLFPNNARAASAHGSNAYAAGQSPSSSEIHRREDSSYSSQRVPVHDQRTVLISNLADRTTHKDITSIIRGGRLLDIFLRHDRTATVSFVEGAAEFLAYAKRNDIYLHQKRLEFSWDDRQFHVPPHVSNKIASGATRNLVVRGAHGKLTADQIRDHLDHIHNLVVVDIYFKDGNAYVFTNSIHNALFAKTCCMSRLLYKGLRIDWHPDECAVPVPRKTKKLDNSLSSVAMKSMRTANRYTLLETEWDYDSDSEEEGSYLTDGINIAPHWPDAAVA